MKRSLSGIYFRVKNEEGKWDNVCFEDLEEERQNEVLKDKTDEWKNNTIKILASKIKELGDAFEIIAED